MSAPRTAGSLTRDEARCLVVQAQGLAGPDRRAEGVTAMLHRLGAVQLDTISVLARSHELVAYARLGPIGREAIEKAYWGEQPAGAFEYWAHASCILPMEVWPYFEFRRREQRRRGRAWHEVAPQACREVMARVRSEGPLTASEFGGAKKGGLWWDWSEVKIAAEWLLRVGDLVCIRRRGWRRVYDLAERAIPSHLLALTPSDEECLTRLARRAGGALGVATAADLHDHYRFRTGQLDPVLEESGLVPLEVEGWPAPGWASPDILAAPPSGSGRTTLLSPFDSLIWDRKRTERIFAFTHFLEAYKPREKRTHGYFAMPLLSEGRLLGRVDPLRRDRTLIARRVSLTAKPAARAMAVGLREAADWVACDAVAVEEVHPGELAEALNIELASLQ